MRFFHHPPTQSLTEWLDLATHDLVQSAQARVRGEIEAHYHEAVQANLANSSSASSAQAAALADLGSPHSAARRFRREYLTSKDAQKISQNYPQGFGRANALLLLFYGIIPVYDDNFQQNFDDPTYPIFLLLHLFIIFASSLIFIRMSRLLKLPKTIDSLRRLCLWSSLLSLIVSPLFVLQYLSIREALLHHAHINLKTGIFQLCFWSIFSTLFICGCYAQLRLRNKLRTATDADLPPPEDEDAT